MSNLVRSAAADSPFAEFFRWLDLYRPSRLSDVTHYIPVESNPSVRLPKGADVNDVTARYDAGVLMVSVPMADAPTEPIKVAVQRAEGDPS